MRHYAVLHAALDPPRYVQIYYGEGPTVAVWTDYAGAERATHYYLTSAQPTVVVVEETFVGWRRVI